MKDLFASLKYKIAYQTYYCKILLQSVNDTEAHP